MPLGGLRGEEEHTFAAQEGFVAAIPARSFRLIQAPRLQEARTLTWQRDMLCRQVAFGRPAYFGVHSDGSE